MTGKSHMTIGLVTYASLWVQPLGPFHAPLLGGSRSLLAVPVALAIVAFGSLLPDIDHPDSSLANEKVIGLPIFLPFAWVIGKIFGHRGVTHSLLAVAGLIALGKVSQLPWEALNLDWLRAAGEALRYVWTDLNLGWLIVWGYAWHMAADALTRSGIPLFWPLPARFGIPPVRRLRFTTDTWPEYLYVTALAIACIGNALRRWQF
ncbi:MAG: metal-dependent hydrolase [Thermomicrobiales bacterium]